MWALLLNKNTLSLSKSHFKCRVAAYLFWERFFIGPPIKMHNNAISPNENRAGGLVCGTVDHSECRGEASMGLRCCSNESLEINKANRHLQTKHSQYRVKKSKYYSWAVFWKSKSKSVTCLCSICELCVLVCLSKPDIYRGISLTCVTAKMYSRIILNQLQKGKAQILPLRRINEEVKNNNLTAVLCFIDFKKAFDSINRGMMVTTLKAYGVPPTLLRAIEAQGHESQGGDTRWWQRGVCHPCRGAVGGHSCPFSLRYSPGLRV